MTVVSLTSRKAEREALKLAEDIQKVCSGHDMAIVACALMGVVASLPQHLGEQLVTTVAAQLAQQGSHGSPSTKSQLPSREPA